MEVIVFHSKRRRDGMAKLLRRIIPENVFGLSSLSFEKTRSQLAALYSNLLSATSVH
jgi:hypothetical protein